RSDAGGPKLLHRREDSEVAVAGAVGRRPGKDAPVRVEAKRDGLAEDDDVVAVTQVLARLLVGGEAVHQDDRKSRVFGVPEVPVEEGHAVDGLDEPLDGAAEAGGHAAVEDCDGDSVEVGLGLLGKLRELVVPKWLEVAPDVVRLARKLAARNARAQL